MLGVTAVAFKQIFIKSSTVNGEAGDEEHLAEGLHLFDELKSCWIAVGKTRISVRLVRSKRWMSSRCSWCMLWRV